jgi:hypothetical protein
VSIPENLIAEEMIQIRPCLREDEVYRRAMAISFDKLDNVVIVEALDMFDIRVF